MAREKMTSHKAFNDYFDLLEKTLSEHNLRGKPSQIYNCDESGMLLEHKLPRVISIKGTKKLGKLALVTRPRSQYLVAVVQLDKLFLLW